MTERDEAQQDVPPKGGRIDARRAEDLVRAVRSGDEQPFGPLQLVRAVIRPPKRGTT